MVRMSKPVTFFKSPNRRHIRLCAPLFISGGVFLAAAFCSPPCRADSDHRKHHPATSSGYQQTLDLSEIVKIIRRDFGGKLLEVELENELIGGRRQRVYEVKLLMPRGNVLKLYFNARTGKLLKLKGHYVKPKKRWRGVPEKKRRGKRSYRYDDDHNHKEHDSDEREHR